MDNQHHGQGAAMSSGAENIMKSTKILTVPDIPGILIVDLI